MLDQIKQRLKIRPYEIHGRDMNYALSRLILMVLSWCSPDAHQFFATN